MSTVALLPDDAATPPVMLIELRQPTEPILDILKRSSQHIRAGVKVVVLLDPESCQVCVARHDELPYTVGIGSVVRLHGIVPDFAVPVAKFFE